MAHTFANLLAHVIFSTKNREEWITPDLKAELLPYMGGIVCNLHGKRIESNACPDHFLGLFSVPPTLAVADPLRVIKTNSCVWVYASHSSQKQLGKEGVVLCVAEVGRVAKNIAIAESWAQRHYAAHPVGWIGPEHGPVYHRLY